MMERLTAKASNGMAYLVKVKPDEQDVDSPYPDTLRCILESFKRLAEYEDTGFSPEEIVNLNTFEGSQIEKLLYKISALENDLEYWHREAINQASQAGEMRIADAWIPCSERLPENSGYYLATQSIHSLKDFNKTLGSDVEYVEFCHGEWKRAKHLEVIAWQPLPEPYKGE